MGMLTSQLLAVRLTKSSSHMVGGEIPLPKSEGGILYWLESEGQISLKQWNTTGRMAVSEIERKRGLVRKGEQYG